MAPFLTFITITIITITIIITIIIIILLLLPRAGLGNLLGILLAKSTFLPARENLLNFEYCLHCISCLIKGDFVALLQNYYFIRFSCFSLKSYLNWKWPHFWRCTSHSQAQIQSSARSCSFIAELLSLKKATSVGVGGNEVFKYSLVYSYLLYNDVSQYRTF